jgi:hypothetical protein
MPGPINVMPGHSRSKNGVASLAYGPGIPTRRATTIEMAGTSPAMTRQRGKIAGTNPAMTLHGGTIGPAPDCGCVRGFKETTTMRTIALAAFLAATLAAPSAFAQGDYVHHKFCLKSGASDQECAYDTMAQCLGSKRSNADTCVPNTPPQDH